MSPFHSWLLIATVAVVIAAGCYLDWRILHRGHKQAERCEQSTHVKTLEAPYDYAKDGGWA